jgi:hypothetical protein
MQFYLYANNHGNIVYQPPEVIFGIRTGTDQGVDTDIPVEGVGDGVSSQSGGGGAGVGKTQAMTEGSSAKVPFGRPKPSFRFVEVSEGPGQYNELKRTYQGTYDSRNTRNAVLAMGLTPLSLNTTTKDFIYTPIIAIQKEEGWPFNTTSHSWQPWLNIVFMQNAEWSVPARVKFIANQTAQRLFNRPFLIARWDAWGQSGIHPYAIVSVDESKTLEVQQETHHQYIVTNISHTFQRNNLIYESSIEGELFIPSYRWVPPMEDYIEGLLK